MEVETHPSPLEVSLPRIVVLVANDRKEVELKMEHACISRNIRKRVEELFRIGGLLLRNEQNTPHPAPRIETGISAECLYSVTQFMQFCAGNDLASPMLPIRSPILSAAYDSTASTLRISEMINNLAKNRHSLYELLDAAVKLIIPGLKWVCVVKIACLLLSVDIEDIDRVLDPHIRDGSLREPKKGIERGSFVQSIQPRENEAIATLERERGAEVLAVGEERCSSMQEDEYTLLEIESENDDNVQKSDCEVGDEINRAGYDDRKCEQYRHSRVSNFLHSSSHVWSCALSCNGEVGLLAANDSNECSILKRDGTSTTPLIAGIPLRCRISHDGRRAVTAGNRNTCYFWNVENGERLWLMEGDPPRSCSLSADGRFVVSASELKNTVTVWDTLEQKQVHTFSHQDVYDCAISRNGTHVVTASLKDLVIWHISGRKRREFNGLSAPCDISCDNSVILCQNVKESGAVILDSKSGSILSKMCSGKRIVDCELSSDASMALISGMTGKCTLWSLKRKDSSFRHEAILVASYCGRTGALSPDGHCVLLAKVNGECELHDHLHFIEASTVLKILKRDLTGRLRTTHEDILRALFHNWQAKVEQ
mmetsp:Transcript_5527/g.8548  ORF Transcript_5527/g.8548 Transcript_5527/m.8548 type:complete len:597 (-) Transcript_5527:330-2120(-)